mmetsp:Transcript_29929/g.35300  ORF Transcript_29929/g.35300 Transcript_29929/m.35300 type:complete len:203 (+) Transcript_29929:140-748(+)
MSRARKNNQLKKSTESALKALEDKQKEAKSLIDGYYADHDTDHDNTLGHEEIRSLLKEACKNSSETALNSAVARIPPGGISRDALPAEFVKIRGYLDQQVYIDKTFQEFDLDRTGFIGRSELIALMTRMAGGVVPPDDDVDFVLRKCDVGHRKGKRVSDGSIDRNEILPVISLWKQVLIERVKGNDPVENARRARSRMCIVS